ncbi:Uncharacterized protein Adt_30575 [Abeliophyllum distichum]|uniref:Putative plant transposon protein domain-containing protein n=1 Tax=Abeliophyllum distichum TaxID=126358 RepID=A0ABD1RCP1_9LAMI
MAAKRPRRERFPSSSSSEEEDPQIKQFDCCPIRVGKNVDLASFTFEAPSFHIEELFVGMGWVEILTLADEVYPSLVKDFYKKIIFSPGTEITCFLKNKRIKITRDLIRSLFRLEDGGIRLYTTKTIPHTEEYNPVVAYRRVTRKYFDASARLSTNQLTLTCRVLHNIIVHIIVPQKGHHDKVNHYDVFLLDSTLLGRKLDFSYIMIQHMNYVLSGTRPKALPYGMILTKVFEHFGVSIHDSVDLLPKATDTINISTLKRMKIFKEDGQWVAKSKGFDDESGPSTLPFEGGEEMDEDEDVPPPRSRSQRPLSSTSGFNDDCFNFLNGRIDSLASTVDGLQHAVSDLQNTAATIQSTVGGLQTSVDGITSLLMLFTPILAPDSLRLLLQRCSFFIYFMLCRMFLKIENNHCSYISFLLSFEL